VSDKDVQSPPRGTLNESRWEEVLNAAAEVFAEKGFRAATLRDVASRLGLLTGSLYYYINTKEDLLYEILKRAHLQGVQFVTDAPGSGSPPERLAQVIRSWMDGLESLPGPLHVEERDFRYLRPDRRSEILSMRRQIARVPFEIIAEGVADGSFDPSINPHVATATLFRIFNGTDQWYRPGGPAEWSEVTDFYVRLMLGGLARSSPAKQRRRSVSP
jgi:TetR/AcrR family transcriptional regulator, cholesterol catabolism regulator